MTKINNTGERILLDKETPLMIARHFCAYKLARSFVKGKRVLDIGCGEGYGADFLAESAQDVLGIDYDKDVIDYAREKYHRQNLRFSVLDIKDLPGLAGKFDIICSFQNIEHIKDTGKLLNDITNLLSPKGIFICSTCNMKDASPNRNIPFNKFHVREYLAQEFKGLLEAHFARVEILGLHRGFALKVFRRLKKIGLFNFLPDRLDPVRQFFARANCAYFFWSKKKTDKALDFIAFCSKE
jgi:2-polyprenyl-3-methyl-5-hydroxy-6-metoxy-1,4-benzoquinol methylase